MRLVAKRRQNRWPEGFCWHGVGQIVRSVVDRLWLWLSFQGANANAGTLPGIIRNETFFRARTGGVGSLSGMVSTGAISYFLQPLLFRRVEVRLQ